MKTLENNLHMITVSEFLDALDKNGYPWTTEHFYRGDGASCAMGQVGRNLGFDPNTSVFQNKMFLLADKLWDVVDAGESIDIIGYNDDEAQSYQDVVEYAHEALDAYKDKEIIF
jgi:hypothetical protein